MLKIAMVELGGKPVLRMATAKMGPCVTDNGNFILDVDFGPEAVRASQSYCCLPLGWSF